MEDLTINEDQKEENSEPESEQFQLELVNEETPRVDEDSAVKDDDDQWEDIEPACKTSKLGLQDIFISVRAVGTNETHEIPKGKFILVKPNKRMMLARIGELPEKGKPRLVFRRIDIPALRAGDLVVVRDRKSTNKMLHKDCFGRIVKTRMGDGDLENERWLPKFGFREKTLLACTDLTDEEIFGRRFTRPDGTKFYAPLETKDLDIFREILTEIAIEAQDHFLGNVESSEDQRISQTVKDEKRPARKRKMSFPGLPDRRRG